MNTPICEFAARYAEQSPLRLHMPGHKGTALLGFEHLDITEIDGADSLYEANGCIRESEQNASALFGCPTFYSTEGASHCIRAMLQLALLHAKKIGRKPTIAAGRNAHKSFLSAAALLDLDVLWLYGSEQDSYLSCEISPAELDKTLSEPDELPAAVYITSPDYLGKMADIRGLSEVCQKFGVLLLVDNAHGAYLRFLSPSQFPMDLGADMCCSSAHKTLPVLTGGAYLHLREAFSPQVKQALALFGSTSPSYLILQSLDAANAYLDSCKDALCAFAREVSALKDRLRAHGFCLMGSDPLKITLQTKPYGYTGQAFAEILQKQNIVCEFADPDFVVLMLTAQIGRDGLSRLEEVLLSIAKKPAIAQNPPPFRRAEAVMSVRKACLAVSETLPIAQSEGRILASTTVGCPPAVPILVCGERIDRHAIESFRYYGIPTCAVVTEQE